MEQVKNTWKEVKFYVYHRNLLDATRSVWCQVLHPHANHRRWVLIAFYRIHTKVQRLATLLEGHTAGGRNGFKPGPIYFQSGWTEPTLSKQEKLSPANKFQFQNNSQGPRAESWMRQLHIVSHSGSNFPSVHSGHLCAHTCGNCIYMIQTAIRLLQLL